MQSKHPHHKPKPHLFIETEFCPDGGPAPTANRGDPVQEQWASECIEAEPSSARNCSLLEALTSSDPPGQHERKAAALGPISMGLQALGTLEKLWRRRMYIQCFNSLRLMRSSLPAGSHSTAEAVPDSTPFCQSSHRLGSTFDNDTSAERARLLAQIAGKLTRNHGGPPQGEGARVQQLSEISQNRHQRAVETKLDRLEVLLRDIKRVNQMSNNQSAVSSVRQQRGSNATRQQRPRP